MRRTLRPLITLLAALGIVASAAAPSGAIINGTPAGTQFPYVGFLIFFVEGDEGGWFSCSGTLVDADTVLTAGHCVAGVGADDLWLTFDTDDTLAGWPLRADYDLPAELEQLDADRRAWLESAPGFIEGLAIPHPEYDDFASFPNTRDVGVVELYEAAPAVGPLPSIAPLGYIDALLATTKKQDALVTTVGYGTQDIVPREISEDTRYYGVSAIQNITSHNAGGYNLQTTNNGGRKDAPSGTCYGDSGGPVLHEGLIVGVVSFGLSPNCTGNNDFSYRTDIADSHTFLSEYVAGGAA